MRFFLSLFLSFCISLTPLYSVSEVPDLMPVYKTDQVTVDSQMILEEMKMAFSQPEVQEEISSQLADPKFQKAFSATLEKQGVEKEDIAELQLALKDRALQEEAFTKIANLDVEKAKALLNDQNFQEETLSQNPEMIAQLNHNIDQMIESDHALGSMAMPGAGPAVVFPFWPLMTGSAVSLAGLFAMYGYRFSGSAILFGGAVILVSAFIAIPAILVTMGHIVAWFGLLTLWDCDFFELFLSREGNKSLLCR